MNSEVSSHQKSVDYSEIFLIMKKDKIFHFEFI